MANNHHITLNNLFNDLTDYDNYTDEELLRLVFSNGISARIQVNNALVLSLAMRLQNAIEERDMVEAEL